VSEPAVDNNNNQLEIVVHAYYVIPVYSVMRTCAKWIDTTRAEDLEKDRGRERKRGRKRDTARRRRWEETRRRRSARTHKSRGWQRMTLRVVNLWITRAHHWVGTIIYAIPSLLYTAMNAGQSNMIITKKLRYARARLCVSGGIGSSQQQRHQKRRER